METASKSYWNSHSSTPIVKNIGKIIISEVYYIYIGEIHKIKFPVPFVEKKLINDKNIIKKILREMIK